MLGRVRDVIPYGEKVVVSFELDVRAEAIDEFIGQLLDIELERHRERRSLSANAYFHVLADKLRRKLGMTMPEVKNHLITSYGQILYMESGEQAVIKTNVEPEKMVQAEYIHTLLVKVEPGVYFYRVYRGSHTYNTAEMSALIDGTVEECKAQGIETVSRDEIDRLLETWRQSHG